MSCLASDGRIATAATYNLPTRIHLDTDLGGDIDDLCALALLLARADVELTGVTTVLEHAGRRAGYVRYVLDLAGRQDVPIAAGADLSLGYAQVRAGLPPEARYWPTPVPPAPGRLDAALDLLQHSIEQGALVLGIGPFTNLAYLEQRKPGTLGRARLCLMGGHVRPVPTAFPAWDHRVDFNVQADPTSARVVFDASEPTLVPIEVTAQTALTQADRPRLQGGGPVARLVAHQAEAFAAEHRFAERYAACSGLASGFINFQHDPLAAAVALGWSGVTREEVALVFERRERWLLLRPGPAGRRLHVVTRVDAGSFNRFWLDTVAPS